MSLAIPTPATAEPRDPGAFGLLMADRKSAACLAVTVVYVLMAILAFTPWLASRAMDPLEAVPQSEGQRLGWKAAATGDVTEYAPPSLRDFPARLLGTDIQNRSVFYRALYGCRTALTIAVCTSVLSLSIGVTLGVLAGYFGGIVDDVINWLLATVSAVPWILLVLALGFVLKTLDVNFFGLTEADGTPAVLHIPDLAVVILAMGLTDWVGVCRLIRGEVLKQRELDYVQAARAMGFSQPRILFRHIVPNTLHLVIITFTLGAVGYVQAEVALTFLGIGISEAPSWGRMIDDAKLELLRGVWWQFAAATLAIGLLSLALTYLGDAFRDILDPRTRSRR